MRLRFLGTGDAGQVPVFGCQCKSCYQARVDKTKRRTPCSVLIEAGETRVLIDAGQTDLAEQFLPGELDAILLTHYHMDHVAGLFHLRWGCNTTLAVFGPDDKEGCADLYKHTGILDFKAPPKTFATFAIGNLNITPIPLNHSKPCYGYCLEQYGRRCAYLTDTIGLPEASLEFLLEWQPDMLVVDCTHPPRSPDAGSSLSLNHNDWSAARQMIEQLQAGESWLTHLSHDMDLWLLDNELPNGVRVAHDGEIIEC